MKIASWIWQLNYDYPGEDGNDGALPVNEVWVKTHAGGTWMGDIYAHPLAPRDIPSLVKFVQVYLQQGIAFTPWCEPTGLALQAEIDIACDVLTALKQAGAPLRLVFDVESQPQPGFWKGTAAGMRTLITAIKTRFPTADLNLNHYQYGPIAFDEIQDLFTSFSTEDYWTDFKTDPVTRLEWSWSHLKDLGRPVIWGLPGNSTAADMQTALAWVKEHGGKAAVWRRGTTTRPVWDTIAAFTMVDPAPPPPPPPPDTITLPASVVGEIDTWLADDAAGAQMRADRWREITGRTK